MLLFLLFVQPFSLMILLLWVFSLGSFAVNFKESVKPQVEHVAMFKSHLKFFPQSCLGDEKKHIMKIIYPTSETLNMNMLPYYWPILKTRTLNKAKNHPPPPSHDPPPHHHVCFTHFHKTSSFFMPQHGAPQATMRCHVGGSHVVDGQCGALEMVSLKGKSRYLVTFWDVFDVRKARQHK